MNGDTTSAANWTDPVYDSDSPHITPVDPELPVPPEHEQQPAEGEPPAVEPGLGQVSPRSTPDGSAGASSSQTVSFAQYAVSNSTSGVQPPHLTDVFLGHPSPVVRFAAHRAALRAVFPRSVAHVLGVSASEQMAGSDAWRVVTRVADLHPGRHWSVLQCVRKAMGGNALSRCVEDAVRLAVFGGPLAGVLHPASLPGPAPLGLLYSQPKPLRQPERARPWDRPLPHVVIVLTTHAGGE